jgi:hypothetical protein
MAAANSGIDALADRIRRYVHEHPNAADTVDGVAAWWLSGSAESDWLRRVHDAIELLVRQGEVSRRTLGDGTVIYERNKDRDHT